MQASTLASLFKRYVNVLSSLVDAALIRLTGISDSPLHLSTDSDFHVYTRHGRQISLLWNSSDSWVQPAFFRTAVGA